MAYGDPKYTIDFSVFTLLIRKKGFFGTTTDLEAGNPAVNHAWDKDDPVAPIKGSNLSANIIGVPLSTFYADNDDEWMGELLHGSDVKFKGYLVQDDCTEDLDDTTHVVSLSFTDNLGLLKDVAFDTAMEEGLTNSVSIAITTSGFNIDIALTLLVGDEFTIWDNGSNLGTYTIATVVDADSYTTTTMMPALSGTYTISFTTVDTASKITLFAAIQACLRATGIDLPLEVFAELKEDNQTTGRSFLEQTLIARESFLKSEREYLSCYEVLEATMSDLNATLVQADGQYNIIRWFEFTPDSYRYNSDFAFTGTGTFTNNKTAGLNQLIYPEYGYQERVFRPYKSVKETFTYKSPFATLKNADLRDIGSLLDSYTTGAGVDLEYVYEYEVPNWTANNIGTPNVIYIRIVENYLHFEIERYLVVEKNITLTSDFIAAFADKIELDQNDVIEYSFQFRTTANHAQSSPSVSFGAILTNGYYDTPANNTLSLSMPPNYGLEWDGKWQGPSGYGGTTDGTSNAYSGVDTSKWQSVTIRSERAPVDGMLYIHVSDLASALFLGSGDETHYKDFSFKVLYTVNDSTKIKGHTHTQTQATETKNKNERDISLDDSPRKTIAGTLFLPTTSPSTFNPKTTQWNTGKRLGEITTLEVKQWRSKARTILEGNLHADDPADLLVSPMTKFDNPAFGTRKFIPGKMNIDYANRVCNCTLHELHVPGEAAVVSTYSFEYIYDTK